MLVVRFVAMKTEKYWWLCGVLFLLVLVAAPGNGEVISVMKINFDPAIEGGYPSILLEPNPGYKEDKPSFLKLVAYALDEKEFILDTKEINPNETFKYYLPNREKEEILGVRIENGEEEVAEWRSLFKLGHSLLNYNGTVELKQPADLKDFWDRAKSELAEVPMEPEITPVPEKNTSTGNLFKVKLNSYGNIPIVCWYYVPKEVDFSSSSLKNYPAIQIMPGWGAEEPPIDRTSQGLITLSLNPRAHGPSKEFFFVPNHHTWNIADPENYYYKAAYMDCLRGIEFLMSRPEVDHKKVGVEGGSQGGALSLATAALDNRIACAVSNVTYLSNFPDFKRLATRGSGTYFGDRMKDPQDGDKVKRSLDLIDVSNLAPWIKCPTQICVGLQDRVCPPVNGIVALNRISEGIPKSFVMNPRADHEVPETMKKANREWFEEYLK